MAAVLTQAWVFTPAITTEVTPSFDSNASKLVPKKALYRFLITTGSWGDRWSSGKIKHPSVPAIVIRRPLFFIERKASLKEGSNSCRTQIIGREELRKLATSAFIEAVNADLRAARKPSRKKSFNMSTMSNAWLILGCITSKLCSGGQS